jgi:hypothetical protein
MHRSTSTQLSGRITFAVVTGLSAQGANVSLRGPRIIQCLSKRDSAMRGQATANGAGNSFYSVVH